MKTIHSCHQGLLSKQYTCEEITLDFLKNIADKNKQLHAYVTVTEEYALSTAQRIDKKLRHDEEISPLAGVPMSLKDNICTKGIRTSCCSDMLRHYHPVYDADAWKSLKQADALLLGKNNMDEFAMGSSCRTSCFGPTYHPLDLTRVPGGSSGGSAAAVRAGLAVYGLGSDTGGSIRQPAAFCGLVGFKPSYGTVSRYGLIAHASSFDQIGPLTSCVADAAQVYETITQIHTGDSSCTGAPQPIIRSLQQSIKGLRIGVDDTLWQYADPSVVLAMEQSIRVLRSAGAELVSVSLPDIAGCLPVYYILASAEASSNLGRYDGLRYGERTSNHQSYKDMVCQTRSEKFGPEVKRRILLGTYALSAGYREAYYQRALRLRSHWQQYFHEIFTQCEIFLLPTTPSVAFEQTWQPDNPADQYRQDIYTVPANVIGGPAISLPCGTGESNLPVGIQLMAPQYEDARLLNVAWCFEQTLKEAQPNGI